MIGDSDGPRPRRVSRASLTIIAATATGVLYRVNAVSGPCFAASRYPVATMRQVRQITGNVLLQRKLSALFSATKGMS